MLSDVVAGTCGRRVGQSTGESNDVGLMESNVRKLYLVDEFDRVYKQLQRPAQAVAKTTSSINVDRTLRDASLPDDEKVTKYVDEWHK